MSSISYLLLPIGVIILVYGPKILQHPLNSNQIHSYKKTNSSYTKIAPKNHRRDNSWVKGLEGENIVLEQLNTLPKNYFVFHDVKLPEGKGNIDHVVIGLTGLFVIETKNYSGSYRLNGKRWYYYKDNKYIELQQNPGTQLMRNILDLKWFLEEKNIIKSKIYVKGIVAFVQNNCSIMQESKNYKVLSPTAIPNYIISHKKTDNRKLLAKIALELEPYCTELTYVPKNEKDVDIELGSSDLTSTLLNSSSRIERSHAAYLIGETKDASYLNVLSKATNDTNSNVRRLSASALGKIGDKRAENALIYLLKDRKPQVRQYAAKALGKVGTRKSIEHLEMLANDEKEYVSKAAQISISKIKR